MSRAPPPSHRLGLGVEESAGVILTLLLQNSPDGCTLSDSLPELGTMSDVACSPHTGCRMARLREGLEAQHPSLGREWYRVIERNEAALCSVPPADQLWVEVGGRLRLLPASIFELIESAL